MDEIQELKEYIIDLEEENENLSEQVRLLTLRIAEMSKDENVRHCDICSQPMRSGYLVNDDEYYCSDECLHKVYSDEEYQRKYENDSAYWTEWE